MCVYSNMCTHCALLSFFCLFLSLVLVCNTHIFQSTYEHEHLLFLVYMCICHHVFVTCV